MYIKTKDLPPAVQSALAQLGFNKTDIEVEPKETYSFSSGGQNGYRSFVAAVNPSTGESKAVFGSWGGANPFVKNPVDSDDECRPLLPGMFVIKGREGGTSPVMARVLVNPQTFAPLLTAAGGDLDLTPQQKLALRIVRDCKSSYRKSEFDREGLGVYGKENPFVKDLIALGCLEVKGTGIQVTLKGKNANRTRG